MFSLARPFRQVIMIERPHPADYSIGTATMGKLDAISSWIKSNPLIVLAGALTTVFGFVISASNVIPVILKALNRPDCFTYADVYRNAWTDFKREGEFWREYPRGEGGKYRYEFREVLRTRDHIDLLNLTPRPDTKGWETLIVRLPVCGGTAKLTIGITEHWINLYEVSRG
jgi:hypothetical protein